MKMKMWLDLLLLVIGFVLLLKGADVFVDGSAGVARIFKVPGVIIGLTIVAMGTSAPELAVSVSAGISGSNAIAVSNVVGSNIFNLLMVLGICAMMKALPVDSGIKKRDYPISLVATLILLILAGNLFFVGKVPDYRNMNASGGVLYRWNGIILIALFVLYLAYTIYLAKKNKETENDEAKKMQEEAQAEKEKYAACQDEIEVEKNKVLDAARASAREEGRQLIENAQKEADKVIRKAGEDARREKDKMLEQAKHEILSLVLDAAAGSMNKKSDDSALYDEFLKKAGTTENEET